jgi:periplasmic protein TonB
LTATSAPDQAQPTPAFAGKPSVSHPPRVEIIALTDDDALLEQIGQALDGEATFRHVESVDAAREFIQPLRPCLLLLDARGQQDLPATIASMQSPDGTCVVVVLTPPDESADVARSLKGSATFAILSIPFDPAPTIAVLDGAREEALARLSLAAQTSVAESAPSTAVPRVVAPITVAPDAAASSGVAPRVVAPTAVTPEPARPAAHPMDSRKREQRRSQTTATRNPEPTGGGQGRTRAFILTGALLVAAAMAWFVLRAPGPDEGSVASATPKQQAEPPLEQQLARPVAAQPATDAIDTELASVDDLLDRARAALNARQYTAPEGDNALALFRAVLAQEPDNDEAREGLQRIGGLLDERLQSELGQRRYNDAAGTLAQLKLIRPNDPRLAPIEAKLAAVQLAAADEARRRQADARAQQLAQLLAPRTRDSKPSEPATDSARLNLTSPPMTQPAFAPPTATQPTLSPSGKTQPERVAQPVANRGNEVRTPSPSQDGAVASPNAPRQVPTGELKRTRYVPPDYPKDALKRGVGGEVRVRFSVDADGKVKSAEVVSSNPVEVFNRAALDAVRRWRFKPPAGGSPNTEATVVTSIVFRPDDAKTP